MGEIIGAGCLSRNPRLRHRLPAEERWKILHDFVSDQPQSLCYWTYWCLGYLCRVDGGVDCHE